jgi:hypothetical protein
VLLTALAACVAAPAAARAASPSARIAFEPHEFSMLSSRYDYLGTLVYPAISGILPKPVPPSNGYLACNGGYSVDLQVRAGPYFKGYIADQFVVLPRSVSPPRGTILHCTSTWGLYTKIGNRFLSSATLTATIVYDTGPLPIEFLPAAVSLKSSGGSFDGTLAYYNVPGLTIRPIPASGPPLSCGGGLYLKFSISAGPVVGSTIHDRYTIDPNSASLPVGTTLLCSSTWGAYSPNGSLLGQSTLHASILYDR